jgi:hypothetical protein
MEASCGAFTQRSPDLSKCIMGRKIGCEIGPCYRDKRDCRLMGLAYIANPIFRLLETCDDGSYPKVEVIVHASPHRIEKICI